MALSPLGSRAESALLRCQHGSMPHQPPHPEAHCGVQLSVLALSRCGSHQGTRAPRFPKEPGILPERRPSLLSVLPPKRELAVGLTA